MYYTRTCTNTHLHSWTLVVFAHMRTHTPSANQPELIRRSKWRKSLTLDSFAKYCASLSQHDSRFPNTQLRRICCSTSSPNLKQYYKINVYGNKDAFQSVWKHFIFFCICMCGGNWLNAVFSDKTKRLIIYSGKKEEGGQRSLFSDFINTKSKKRLELRLE